MMGLNGTQGLAVLAITVLAAFLGVRWGRAAPQGRRLDEEQTTAPKKRKTSNIILLAMGLFALAFIIAMTVIFCVRGAVPDTLIQCTLGAGGVEALLLAGIKISKVIAGDKPGGKESSYEQD